MAQFSVNAQRFDPYKTFKFRIKWDGRYVAGISKVAGLKLPGRNKFEPIILERGVTHDQEFEQWASKLWNDASGLGTEVPPASVRKDLILEVYNEAGQPVLAYTVFRAWVSEYQALPDLDANANTVAIQHITLENEGWKMDHDVVEPAEP